MEPFKCDYVPTSAVVVFCLQHKTMMQMIHDGFGNYITKIHWNQTRYERKQIADNFYKSDLVKALKAITQLHFNYMDNTMLSNSTVYRFVRIYRKEILKINYWFK